MELLFIYARQILINLDASGSCYCTHLKVGICCLFMARHLPLMPALQITELGFNISEFQNNLHMFTQTFLI